MSTSGNGPKTAASTGKAGFPSQRPPMVLGFVGPPVNAMPMGMGVVLEVPSGGVSAGGTITISHPLGRVPVFVLPLINGTPGYPGGAYITAASATQVTIEFENAQSGLTSFFYLS